jgi:hypothetical protein
MTLVVTFTGKSPLTVPGEETRYRVWSYTVRPTSPTDLPRGWRVALALPADAGVLDPALFPGVPAVAGTSLETDGLNHLYLGRPVSGVGTQTISFLAPQGQGERELMLVTQPQAGRAWTPKPFATSGSGTTGTVQTLPAPAPVPVSAPARSSRGGRPADDTGLDRYTYNRRNFPPRPASAPDDDQELEYQVTYLLSESTPSLPTGGEGLVEGCFGP